MSLGRYMVRFLTNPFNDTGPKPNPGGSDESVPVTSSILVCEMCFSETSEGTYYPGSKRLTWECSKCGEFNSVKGIEL